jgi:hypothetical protein
MALEPEPSCASSGYCDGHFLRHRRKYDARKALEALSAKLRDETDLDRLGEELVGVVRSTIQPTHVGLWLRPDEEVKAQGVKVGPRG